jgi:hypothetical protein
VRHLQAPVEQLRLAREGWSVHVRHQGVNRTVLAARVICATGSQPHVRYEPLLRRCRSDRPATKVGGLPVLEPDLRWPGTAVHVMGPLAMVAVGPACRTVIGARIAAERMLSPMTDRMPKQYPG